MAVMKSIRARSLLIGLAPGIRLTAVAAGPYQDRFVWISGWSIEEVGPVNAVAEEVFAPARVWGSVEGGKVRVRASALKRFELPGTLRHNVGNIFGFAGSKCKYDERFFR